MLKDKSFFSRIITLVLVCVVCIALTIITALIFGSIETTIFDFSKLNFANVIPVLIIGCFISCVVIGIFVLFVAKDGFIKVKDYFKDTKEK